MRSMKEPEKLVYVAPEGASDSVNAPEALPDPVAGGCYVRDPVTGTLSPDPSIASAATAKKEE